MSRGSSRRLAVAAAAGLLVLGTVGAVALREDDAPADAAGTSALPFPDPGVVHVHGLGVDPADGALYAATHSGLFRVADDGSAERVGDLLQDTMGFTVAGPGTFLGSGHPDPRAEVDGPPLLGLVRSTDAGRTWQPLSLDGEADFHALESAHGRVYGHDSTSGTVMVSEDGRTWDRRAQVPLRDLAVSPSDPEALLGTTGQGPARSADGGRTWELVRGAPVLAVLAWPAEGELYGVAPEGRVHVSTDGGATWAARGEAGGAPEAVTAADGALHVAVTDRGIVSSQDGGRTFDVRYASS